MIASSNCIASVNPPGEEKPSLKVPSSPVSPSTSASIATLTSCTNTLQSAHLSIGAIGEGVGGGIFVGAGDGLSDGIGVGTTGAMVGVAVGAFVTSTGVGAKEGDSEIERVGELLGDVVGAGDGDSEGAADGAGVAGAGDGDDVGRGVGFAVGRAVGAAVVRVALKVGTGVGANVGAVVSGMKQHCSRVPTLPSDEGKVIVHLVANGPTTGVAVLEGFDCSLPLGLLANSAAVVGEEEGAAVGGGVCMMTDGCAPDGKRGASAASKLDHMPEVALKSSGPLTLPSHERRITVSTSTVSRRTISSSWTSCCAARPTRVSR